MTGGSSSRRAVRTRPTKLSLSSPHSDGISQQRKVTKRGRSSSGDHGPIPLLKVPLRLLMILTLSGIFFCAITIYYYYGYKEEDAMMTAIRRIVTPLDAPKMMDLPQFQGEHKESLYWGTYRPHVYLGIRARTPKSLIAGLMWIGEKDGQYSLRHVCQDSDGLKQYGWLEHNGRDYGRQLLVDHGLVLTTSFLKYKGSRSGYGGDWAVRVNMTSENSIPDDMEGNHGHLFFYIFDEEGNPLYVGKHDANFDDDTRLAFGSRKDVGSWELHMASKDDVAVHYIGLKTSHLHNLTELLQSTLAYHARRTELLQLPDTSEYNSNILFFQISAKLPAEVDIGFLSATSADSSDVKGRFDNLSGAMLSSRLTDKARKFEERYIQRFNFKDKVDLDSMTVGKAALGNLLGGLGFFHGQSKIALPKGLNMLMSGLDDYPRASHPSEDELHLDLRCWMLLAADCMQSMAKSFGIKDSLKKGYDRMVEHLSNFEILNQMHLDVKSGAYFDFGNHTENVCLKWHEVRAYESTRRELIRVVLEKPQLSLVPHVGYLSLFPFMMGIIPPDSWVLEKQLELISNRSALWTDYGLRSLARTSTLYMKRNTEHDPPYWRGPIWINMNYMVLSALHHYSQKDGPYRDRTRTIYTELRTNVIRNIVRNYHETGFLWEQYHQKNRGKGQRARPFTGWTALVLLIMSESYPKL